MKKMRSTIFGITILTVMIFSSVSNAQENSDEYIKVFNSSQDFQTTVQTIKSNADKNGWAVLGIKMMHDNLKKAGYNILPVAVIEVCNPHFAGDILSKNETRLFSALMPCRVSVYEVDDGKVQIAMLNSYLASDMYKDFDLTTLFKATVQMEKIISPDKWIKKGALWPLFL